MEKRVFVAILLSFAVLAVYQMLMPAPPPPEVAVSSTTTSAPAATSPEGSATTAGVDGAVPPPSPAAAPLVADTAAREVVVETDEVRAVFSTRGATLVSWQLKHYLDDGQPLELVPSDVPASYPQPFAISTNDAAISATLQAALFRPSVESLSLGSTAGQLTFEYRDAAGLSARKTFFFQPEGRAYVLKVEATVDLAGASKPVTLAVGPGIGLGYQPDGSRFVAPRAIYNVDGKVTRVASDDLDDERHQQKPFQFVGVEDQYFLSAALPAGQPVTVDFEPVTLPIPGAAADKTRTLVSYALSAPGSVSMTFFVGPKQFEALQAVDSRLDLVKAIDFGWMRILAVQLLIALNWVNGFVGNYGWSIVLLTVIINALIFPLRHRSMVSMRKMQALQPQVKAIQERYAKFKVTDPERQKMNQEMMALYRQHGVNPASGCVPMLLTMPILFAFYSLLSAAIELRGAPFFGWITDLSRHDPLYITPILMGLSMLWQQRMMPTTADPIQQKIFLLMPVIFTVSFLWAPSGLVVYWFCSNLLAIGQQYFTNSRIGPPPARPAPALAKSR